MPVLTRSPRRGQRARRVVTGASSAIILTLVAVGGVVLPAAVAAPNSERVTICHRTHAVTNPYRLITVSANAADGFGANDHSSHNLAYETGGITYPVFDPTVSYPSNAKHWGDIIPPVRNGAGLNWTAPNAQAIYSGTGAYYGLCGRLSAKQFFDLEVAAGVNPADVLADLDDQSSLEDQKLKDELGITNFSDLDPSNLPSGFESVPPTPRGPRPPVGYGPEKGMQKIAVLVWYDLDRDGEYDVDELPAPGVDVVLNEVAAPAPASLGSTSTLTPAAGGYVTDANGLVIIDSVNAGQWEVGATKPTETDVTYDSEGTTDDGMAQVDVPADSAGFAWVGLVPAGTTTEGGTRGGEALAATGPSTTVMPLLAGAASLLLLGFALRRGLPSARRRPAAR